ncbi:ComEC/Rec2 family competence protein [Paracidovorax avenae]|uniref:ComEC/Rec2 family competence protein n=1 Tax=Paracidovorax avenae TaxID=80867 RepID=UPI001AD81BAE|nr:hypothetical protein [Paracidovorax avenae]
MTIEIQDGLLQVFNVDHGACALLSLPTQQGVKRVLIDCGHAADCKGTPWSPGDYLGSIGVNFVDLLICTNYDEDHASGAKSLIDNGVSVGCILGNPTVPAEVIEYLKSGDGMGDGIRIIANSLADRHLRGVLQVPPVIPGLELRWFYNPWPHWNTENNLSLVSHLSIHGTNFLFPGDLETNGWRNMLKHPHFAALMPNVQVLMAAHHGRASGKCEELFDIYGCFPQLIVISDCAKQYQSQETVPYYRHRAKGVSGVRGCDARYVMTTREDGTLFFRWEGKRCLLY